MEKVFAQRKSSPAFAGLPKEARREGSQGRRCKMRFPKEPWKSREYLKRIELMSKASFVALL
jgi:hypothetical protein